ncbi:hypothetical protein KUTeg_014976 [Tegillarca granosa]|uniref:IQ calmodulin-binding motif-containing protein 1 n=1 Tax=Tegillarca granosa TaxID=220873 RepID=A0ABQ9ENR7_TEGGR|nr:hypothetical protein KUTeg_014976 [Tegillarca granosa]
MILIFREITMSARFASPTRDKRVINLAAEVAETRRDRNVPFLLLSLKEILSTAQAGTKEGIRIRQEIWEYNLLQVLILVLKQDFSIVDGQWNTATALCAILSQVCSGMRLSSEDMKKFESQSLPEAINNMFLVTRRIQARYTKIPDKPSLQRDRQPLLTCYRAVLDSITYVASGHSNMISLVLESPWLLQLLITEDASTVIPIMEMIPKVLRMNRSAVKDMDQKSIFTVMDELIYKLTVCNEVSIGAAATKCVLRICDYHKDMVEHLCTRYRGLKPLLVKWEEKGFNRDLRDLLLLLQAGNAQRAENERFAIAALVIQRMWRGYNTRTKLAKADKAFSKFQKAFRIFIFVLHVLSTLNVMLINCFSHTKVETYLQNEQTKAAIIIQKNWRRYDARTALKTQEKLVRKVKSAVIIQRAVRRWLEKLDKKRSKIPASVKPPGLTDERRVELQKKISAFREKNPSTQPTQEEAEALHKKTAELLNRYYRTARKNRERQHQRDVLLARLDTDSELICLAPTLKDATEKDAEMYSSRSLPVATKARVNHMEQLKLMKQPWWKKLTDEYQDQEYEDEDLLMF